jgi:phage gp29-like protein
MAKPNLIELREPSVRAVATWSPVSIRAALQTLFHGKFSQAAYLADALLGDDRVQAVISTRVNGILALPLKFEPADDSPGAAEISELIEQDFWDIAPEPVAAELMTYGLLLGACPAELVWKEKDDRVIPELKVWHPSQLRWDPHERTYKLRLESGEMQITPGDGKWMIYTPNGSRRPWTRALVRSLAVPWLAKSYAVGDWNRYSEVLGGAVKRGTVPGNAKPEDKQQFKSDLRNLASDGVVIVPAEFSFDLVEATGRGSDTFKELIAWADKAIAVAVLGQNLTTEVSGGSFAAAKVHNSVRQDLIDADTEGLATVLHDDVLSWWAEFNRGDRRLAPWPRWQTDPPPEDGKIYPYHLQAPIIKKNQLLEKIGLPAVSDEEGGNDFVVINQDGAGTATTGLEAAGSRGPARTVRLASGDSPGEARGLLNGQLYSDALAERGWRRSAEALRGDLDKVLAVVERSRDYGELRTSLLELYPTLNPEALSRVLEQALILANLAGRLAETEDGGS